MKALLIQRSVFSIFITSLGKDFRAVIAAPQLRLSTRSRSKTWITPAFAAKYAGPNGSNFDYTDEQKEKFRGNEEEHRE